MDSKTFWRYRDSKRDSLLQQHSKRLAAFRASQDPADLEGQPASGKSLFIVSREILEVSPAGSVTEASYGLAAQRIVEGSHDVAKPEQIAAFLELQGNNLVVSRAMEAQSRERQMITVTPAATAPLQPRAKQ